MRPPPPDLFDDAGRENFIERAISPTREMGAYEALWSHDGTWFDSLAEIFFRKHPGSLPSDFIPAGDGAAHAARALAAIRAAGIGDFGVRVHGAGEYPERLRDAEHPPALLYFRGDWDLVHGPGVAIIGTRHPSPEGRRLAAGMASRCAAGGYTVISGLARGIDTVAHTAAMAAAGATIAVLGTPITESYPPENHALQQHIGAGHLLISQVPVVTPARRRARARSRFFPERNATMSALSRATVIVEAGARSGALVQGRHALRQGRPLFILDRCFASDLDWPARFLAMGAIRIADDADIGHHLAAAHTRPTVED